MSEWGRARPLEDNTINQAVDNTNPRTMTSESKVETPCKIRQIAGPQYRTGSLHEARSAVVDDVGRIPLVSFDFFCQSVLLEVPSDAVKKSANDLQTARVIQNGRWKAFPRNPKSMKAKESDVFKPLKDIFDAIVQTAQ